jgi:hypothetical protein
MEYGKEMLDKLKANKEKGANKIILEQTEGTFTASAIGLFLGLYVGYSRNYNMVASGLIGALLAGFISKQLIQREKKSS